ncbi:MAG TPA: hypothetical protein VGJ32_01795 [Solirubrobacteraceae bacterium]|jgi:hypothetical protein
MSSQFQHAVRDGITRTLAIVGLAGVALIHLLDAPGKFTETPYLGWMYIGLIAGCLLAAGALLGTSDRRAWAAAVALPASAIAGYVLTRTVGLPQATDDIGNWGEPLGIASLFVEGALVALSGGVLALRAGAAPAEARPARRARRMPQAA